LLALGAGPETPVAICARRSPELIAGLLGILKAGAAYVPLDPTSPGPRLATLVAASRAPVLIVGEGLVETPPPLPAGVALLDLVATLAATADAPAMVGRAGRRRPAGAASPDSLAYVIYTSGSTGEPKGVAVPHRGVVRLVTGTA